MADLWIDLETFSDVDIMEAGLYRYVDSPAFEILLFGFAFDDAEPTVVDIACGDRIPQPVIEALFNPGIRKHAWNAQFEWRCFAWLFNLSPADAIAWAAQWHDTQTAALYCGFPAKLAAAGPAIGIEQDKQKMASGGALIRTFSIPCAPTKKNGMRTRTLPHHEPERWASYKAYNARDVEVERSIARKLRAFPVPQSERFLWYLDLIINARGVPVHMPLVNGAIAIGQQISEELTREAVALTQLDNPGSVVKLKAWLKKELEEDDLEPIKSLTKPAVQEVLDLGVANDRVLRMLELRQMMSKTSTSKYDKVKTCVCSDGRVRGLFMFYGAQRTGRFAGRLVQVQNLPRNYIKTLDLARGWTVDRNTDMMRFVYGSVPDTLSQLIRTTFIPSEGRKLIVADFSAIEARVIAWLANERWVMEVFAGSGKIYEATYAQMFGIPAEDVDKSQRQIGKVAQLALGYQGGVNALEAMMKTYHIADELIPEDLRPVIVKKWRRANPSIVRLWHDMQETAIEVIRSCRPLVSHGIRLAREMDVEMGMDFLTIQLPSGRKLYYDHPTLEPNKYDSYEVLYLGVDQVKKIWGKRKTYGGSLVENIVQAIARDCLTTAMVRLERREDELGEILMHVHDEVVLDSPLSASVDVVCDVLSEPIEWAGGLILTAAGFETLYYKKD